jgi:hypothetical protein
VFLGNDHLIPRAERNLLVVPIPGMGEEMFFSSNFPGIDAIVLCTSRTKFYQFEFIGFFLK